MKLTEHSRFTRQLAELKMHAKRMDKLKRRLVAEAVEVGRSAEELRNELQKAGQSKAWASAHVILVQMSALIQALTAKAQIETREQANPGEPPVRREMMLEVVAEAQRQLKENPSL